MSLPIVLSEKMHCLQDNSESNYQKGVKHLCENGIDHVPAKYILPEAERPNVTSNKKSIHSEVNLKLPIIDCAELKGPNRAQVLESLAHACENYGFFQLVNHDIPTEITKNIVDVSQRFFELPFIEREKYMSTDLSTPIRYGTSFNQTNDDVFCWRDFLKLVCHPLPDVISHWPSSPTDFKELAFTYSKHTKFLFLLLVEAILESLIGLKKTNKLNQSNDILKEMENGSQIMVMNCYPPCPDPDLTVGMSPHSDYGFLTLLLQDEVRGLQIQHKDKWVTIEPIPGSYVVNVGDHLEIFSNGRYKSVLHRVLVNSTKYRFSIASLHSFSFTTTVRPWMKLINETNPRRYKDTDFATFLENVQNSQSRKKSFLESRKIY